MRAFTLLMCLFIVSGCTSTRTLMPTPTLYTSHQNELFGDLSSELLGDDVNLLYATDRVSYRDKQNKLIYNAQRSPSLVFGSARLSFSHGSGRTSQIADKILTNSTVKLETLKEMTRFPPTPYPFALQEGQYRVDQNIISDFERADENLGNEIIRRLELSPRKDVFLFIHGADNTLEFALETWAGMWHFLGREGVPVVYSWPAGSSGAPLTSYSYDRESGEFTIFHLKQFLKSISSIDQVERIHIVAHSRGSDVITTVLRELFIEARAANVNMLQRYKIANLLLIAPDMDMEIVGQRLAAERLAEGIGHVTIYVSPTDKALGLASVLFGSVLRFGQIKTENIPEQVRIGDHINNIAFIEVNQTPGLGHGYFYENPAVSSDIILLLRYSLPAGSSGRPLNYIRPNFWKIPDSYLKPQ